MTLANAKVMLQEQPDFKAQRMWLVETIIAFNHSVLFLPKYHCEFNFIETVWGCAKMYSRRHCDYSIPKAIASVSLTTIRPYPGYARRCERYTAWMPTGQSLLVTALSPSHRLKFLEL